MNSNISATIGFGIGDIADLLTPQDVVLGTASGRFSNVSDIVSRTSETLDWISGKCKSPADYLISSPAHFVVCPMLDQAKIPQAVLASKTLILTDNPKLLFAKIVNKLFVQVKEHSISLSARIDREAVIGANVHIGANCVIGKVVIGDNTVIMDNCSIFDSVKIGKNVVVKPGAQLGLGGFGFVRDENRDFVNFPQLGGLVIEDDVEIGPQSCIDKGSLSITKICRGTKIGAFVKIAHNCIIGKSCFIGAQVFIGGSVTIGDYNWIAPGVLIRDQIRIGSNSMCGLGSVVVKDISDNELWLGNPARFERSLKDLVL